jgi:hypothetical protein
MTLQNFHTRSDKVVEPELSSYDDLWAFYYEIEIILPEITHFL